jgi:hypothetical protein
MKPSILILIAAATLIFSGCGSVKTLEAPTPAAVSHLTDSKEFAIVTTADPFPSSLFRGSANASRDYTVQQGLHVIAQTGKDRGYNYFALTSPALLDNVSGSSITSAYEVFAICGAAGAREVLTAKSQCKGINPSGIATYYRAVYFKEKPVDFLVWDIEKTLADPLVANTDISFEHEALDLSDYKRIKERISN